MKQQNIELIKKGIFALSVVAFIGTTTVVYAAVNSNNSLAGYGTTSEQANAAVDQFTADYEELTDSWIPDVKGYVQTARAALVAQGADEAVDDFELDFDTSSFLFYSSVQTAEANFKQRIQNAASLAETKDEFIRLFSEAKNMYFNDLDVAKNQLASMLSNMGHNSNVIKDNFMNSFNSRRDRYSNELEGIKNTFADQMNNIR